MRAKNGIPGINSKEVNFGTNWINLTVILAAFGRSRFKVCVTAFRPPKGPSPTLFFLSNKNCVGILLADSVSAGAQWPGIG